jgi:Holliday junction resolvasome RuvABC endonuclease subunit
MFKVEKLGERRSRLVMGIDASLSNTGVAVCTPEGALVRLLTIKSEKGDGENDDLRRLLHLSDALSHLVHVLLEEYAPEQVVAISIEGMAFGMAGGRMGQLGGAHWACQLAVAQAWRTKTSLPFPGIREIASPRARKLVLGRAPPREIKQAQVKAWVLGRLRQIQLPIPATANDHEADALITALAGAVEANLRLPALPPPESIQAQLMGEIKKKAPRSKPRA